MFTLIKLLYTQIRDKSFRTIYLGTKHDDGYKRNTVDKLLRQQNNKKQTTTITNNPTKRGCAFTYIGEDNSKVTNLFHKAERTMAALKTMKTNLTTNTGQPKRYKVTGTCNYTYGYEPANVQDSMTLLHRQPKGP